MSFDRYIASVNFGKDSLAMVLLILERGLPLDEVVFYDTGMEFKAIYDTRDRVLPILYGHGVKYTELRPPRPFLFDMLEKPVSSKKNGLHYGYSWCGGCARWGTANKTSALDKHAKAVGKNVIQYIGIAADEQKRLQRLPLYKVAPLAKFGFTEADALAYCYDRGFFWEENGIRLYDVLDRVSCWCCANKNLKELRNIRTHLPKYWNRLKDRIAFHANEHRHTYEIGKGVMDALVLDLLADFRDAGGVILPVKPNGTVWLIRRRRVVSATVMFVGAGADGLTSFSVLRGRLGTTAWSSEQFTEHDIGKTVFLTKEAAEAALEGGGAWQQ